MKALADGVIKPDISSGGGRARRRATCCRGARAPGPCCRGARWPGSAGAGASCVWLHRCCTPTAAPHVFYPSSSQPSRRQGVPAGRVQGRCHREPQGGARRQGAAQALLREPRTAECGPAAGCSEPLSVRMAPAGPFASLQPSPSLTPLGPRACRAPRQLLNSSATAFTPSARENGGQGASCARRGQRSWVSWEGEGGRRAGNGRWPRAIVRGARCGAGRACGLRLGLNGGLAAAAKMVSLLRAWEPCTQQAMQGANTFAVVGPLGGAAPRKT
jgi:hypothetical protein